MSNLVNLNPSEFLLLNNDIRISSTSTFNAQEAYETAFEDVISEIATKNEEEKENKITFSNLGAPSGFFLDMSLMNEEDKLELSSSFLSY